MNIENPVNNHVWTQFVLSEADRQVQLTVDRATHNATTFIEKKSVIGKRPGTTTKLYNQVVEILKAEAARCRAPVQWILVTDNPNMTAWIQSQFEGSHPIGPWESLRDVYGRTQAIMMIYPPATRAIPGR